MACQIQPYGLIGERWDEGVFGCPIAPEEDVPGRRGRRQRFTYGQIAWSPDQGDQMMVEARPGGALAAPGTAIFQWGPTSPYHYGFFIVRWTVNGNFGGQQDLPPLDEYGINGYFEVQAPLDQIGDDGLHATIEFIVEGCDGNVLSPSDCRQGWTIPVQVRV